MHAEFIVYWPAGIVVLLMYYEWSKINEQNVFYLFIDQIF